MSQEAIYDLQDRVNEALAAGKMTREAAIAELVAGGFDRPLAIDFVAVILDHRGE